MSCHRIETLLGDLERWMGAWRGASSGRRVGNSKAGKEVMGRTGRDPTEAKNRLHKRGVH